MIECPEHIFEDGVCINCGGAEPESVKPQVPLRHIDAANEDVAGKLRKMVALAHDAKDDVSRQGEFESAMAAAVKFSQRHAIDLSTIDPSQAAKTDGQLGISSEKFLNLRVKVADGMYRRPPAHKFVVGILDAHFSVEIIRGIGTASSIIWIIGRESHVKFAEFAYFYLVETFNRFWRAHKRQNDCMMSDRASYFYGFWWGLHDKLKKAQEEGKREIIHELAEKTTLKAAEVSTSYQVAVVKEQDLLKQATSGYHPVLLPGKNNFQAGVKFGSSALYHGKHDGATVEVARPLDKESTKVNSNALP